MVDIETQVELIKPDPDILYPLIKELNPGLQRNICDKYLQDMIKSGYFVIGAHLNSNLVGLTGCWLNTKFYCGKYLEIDNFIITKSARGKNIGSKIVEFCIDLAKQENCNSLILNVYTDNILANEFYDKFKFETIGKHRLLKL